MLVDSEPIGGMLPLTELGHGRQGQNQNGGSEMGKQPRVGMGNEKFTTLTCKMLPTYQEEPKLTTEGRLYTL